ncbi:MAG: C-GCAxxG-C-C family protein [Gemmatimonadota bacterium]
MAGKREAAAEGAGLGARELFSSGYNCSQAVLLAAAGTLGVGCECMAKAAAGLGGGLGRTGEACGALTGGVMCIGLAMDHETPGTPEEKEALYAVVRRFVERFERENGARCCRDLLGVDLSTPEGRAESRQKDHHNTVCAAIVERAARAVVELSLE